MYVHWLTLNLSWTILISKTFYLPNFSHFKMFSKLTIYVPKFKLQHAFWAMQLQWKIKLGLPSILKIHWDMKSVKLITYIYVFSDISKNLPRIFFSHCLTYILNFRTAINNKNEMRSWWIIFIPTYMCTNKYSANKRCWKLLSC